MKRYTAILLMLFLFIGAFALTACGNDNNPKDQNGVNDGIVDDDGVVEDDDNMMNNYDADDALDGTTGPAVK